MEREAPFIFLRASCLLRCPTQASWYGFGSQSFPKAPERSARFARCARSLAALASPWCVFVDFSLVFESFLILEIVSISIDLNWIFMPTWLHVGLIFRLLVHLGASWARLGCVLGRLGCVLRRSWGFLGASWVVLGRLGNVLDASWAPLGSSWRGLGRLLTRLGGVLGASWNRLGTVLNLSST